MYPQYPQRTPIIKYGATTPTPALYIGLGVVGVLRQMP